MSRTKDNQKQQAEQPSYGKWGSYRLTQEQLQAALSALNWDLLNDDGDNKAGLLLCVLRSFTYAESSDRENMLVYAEEALMPYIDVAHEALNKLAIQTHKRLAQEGGRA